MERYPGMPDAVDELGNWLKRIDDHLRHLNAWTDKVTQMLQAIDWEKLKGQFGRHPRAITDPPGVPPPWPPK